MREIVEREVPCARCKGTGGVINDMASTLPWETPRSCPDCEGTGEIRTPVTLPEILAENGAVEMWAVFSEGSPLLLARTEDLAWKLAMQLFQDNKASLLELDYTCEQVSVIRRNP